MHTSIEFTTRSQPDRLCGEICAEQSLQAQEHSLARLYCCGVAGARRRTPYAIDATQRLEQGSDDNDVAPALAVEVEEDPPTDE